MLSINTFSFTADDAQPAYAAEYNWVYGTAEVSLMGKIRRCAVRRVTDQEWAIFDLAAKYPSGGKVWRATANVNVERGTLSIFAGVESRAGRIARQPRLVGFIHDVPNGYISKR